LVLIIYIQSVFLAKEGFIKVSWLPIFLHSNEVIDHLKSLRALSVVLREFSLEFNVALEFIEGFLALIVIIM